MSVEPRPVSMARVGGAQGGVAGVQGPLQHVVRERLADGCGGAAAVKRGGRGHEHRARAGGVAGVQGPGQGCRSAGSKPAGGDGRAEKQQNQLYLFTFISVRKWVLLSTVPLNAWGFFGTH